MSERPVGTGSTAAVGIRAVLVLPAARRLWLAGIGAGVVRWLGLLAFGLWALAATGSPLIVSLMGFMRFLPLLLLGATAASVADRVGRKRLLLSVHGGLAVVDTGVAVLAFANLLNPVIVGAAALASGVFWVFEATARRSALADAAGLHNASASMGLDMMTSHATRIFGPALGGALLSGVGIGGVFVLNALLYLAGFVLILRTPITDPPPPPRAHLLREVREGGRYLFADVALVGLLLTTLVVNLLGLPYMALAPVIGRQSLGLSDAGTGLLMTGEGIGSVLGTLIAMRFVRLPWIVPTLTWSAGLFLLALIAFTAAPVTLLAYPALLFVGLGMGGFSAMQATMPMTLVPSSRRMIVMGGVMVAVGTAPLGFILAGYLADRTGAPLAIAVFAGMGLVLLAAMGLRWPQLFRPRHHHARNPT
ncbi:MAG: MFS transporter [Geminicoccaceae bacterium]